MFTLPDSLLIPDGPVTSLLPVVMVRQVQKFMLISFNELGYYHAYSDAFPSAIFEEKHLNSVIH